jgi:hypothetical protein
LTGSLDVVGTVIFWAVVVGLLVGSFVLERRRRHKLQRAAEAGTLALGDVSKAPPLEANSAAAAEALLRGGMPGHAPLDR